MSTAGPAPAASSSTMLDSLIEHLRSKDVALDGQARPVAVLWTDPKGEWRGLIEMMQTRVEEVLVLGDYRPEGRSGPAVWIRCLVDQALDEPALPEDRAPIIYLPGVARQELRAGEACGEEQAWGAMSFPVLAKDRQSPLGQRDVAVLASLAVNVKLHTRAIHIGNLELYGFAQAQTTRVDRGQAGAVVRNVHTAQDPPHFVTTEDHRQPSLSRRPNDLEHRP